MGESKVIECVYEGGVFKPLEKVNMKEGTKLKIRVEKIDLSKYRGIFGKASPERLEELVGEAWL
jgi:predicted DNA-binding antitoxin AbrB/MazE fold protein